MTLTILVLLSAIIILTDADDLVVDRYQRIIYQLKHNFYVNKVYFVNYRKVSMQILLHDLDKIMPIILGFERTEIKSKHRLRKRHHLSWIENNQDKVTQLDVIELACDWEAARFSKPEKQKTAAEVFQIKEERINKLNKELAMQIRFECLKIKS